MELFETIAKRYSYRGPFTATPVPREDLVKIVLAGIRAPSGKNEQTTSFAIVDDRPLLQEIAAVLDRPACLTAQAMIACVVDPRPILGDLSLAAEDCAAAVENMLLAITALGYATVWMQAAFCSDETATRIGRLLGVPSGRRVRILLPLGVPETPGLPKEKLPFEQRAWFNKR